MEVVYEDNHLIIVNKACGEIVQGDRTGDEPLVETLKRWIKEKYQKPGKGQDDDGPEGGGHGGIGPPDAALGQNCSDTREEGGAEGKQDPHD